jgi:hypothetical protein
LTVSANAGIVQSTTHNKMFRKIKALRFFVSMFKPLCGRKTTKKTRTFTPLNFTKYYGKN